MDDEEIHAYEETITCNKEEEVVHHLKGEAYEENFRGEMYGMSESLIHNRMGFIRKVYGILCTMLLVTVGFCYIAYISKAYQ